MKDVLRKIYVEPTNRCNLNCAICVRRVWNEPAGDMPLAAFRSISAQLKDSPDLETISFGGYGEPLIHPDIVERLRCAKRAGAEAHLITNGCFLDREMSAALIGAGLDRVVVSLDGATDAPHNRVRGKSQFALVKQNGSSSATSA